ncbi:MAG TPA: UrcA family protein [Steroidobacteraceae bacterium]|nr:UrcA family protein [Steroidobacteraceae bacterium]
MSSNVKSDKRRILGYAAAMWLACTLVAFNANADDGVRSETVKFADLNLDTPAGVEALYRRIHAAAQRVCDQPFGQESGIRPCMTKAESEAISKVNVPLLTAFYQKKSGILPPTVTASR